jgi:hypothetical protein
MDKRCPWISSRISGIKARARTRPLGWVLKVIWSVSKLVYLQGKNPSCGSGWLIGAAGHEKVLAWQEIAWGTWSGGLLLGWLEVVFSPKRWLVQSSLEGNPGAGWHLGLHGLLEAVESLGMHFSQLDYWVVVWVYSKGASLQVRGEVVLAPDGLEFEQGGVFLLLFLQFAAGIIKDTVVVLFIGQGENCTESPREGTLVCTTLKPPWRVPWYAQHWVMRL